MLDKKHQHGKKHSNFSVANSQDGSSQMVKRIFSAVTSHSLDTVVIGMEATSVYGNNLVYFLREDATLTPFNRKIHVLNPKQVKTITTCQRTITWTPMSLLTACALAESTKKFILGATAIMRSRTSQGHVSLLPKTSSRKNSVF